MPGTIQVSVLEFKSSSSSSASSSLSIKVSIGKTDYQTWDKGDFSFPLTTLRDDLIVTLLDADGNRIAHTSVRTMSIVEKGSWDDIFPLEGGGHVHLKLQFSLSEEDRSRIRTMRESAIKKKKNSKSASVTEGSTIHVDQKASDRSEGVSIDSKIQETEVPLHEANQRESIERHETALPLTNVQLKPLSVRKALSDMQSSGSEFPRKKDSVAAKLDDDSLDKSEGQGPLDKTPSNVRKMISAFESNQDQDARSPKKPPILKSQHNKVGKGGPFKDQNLKDVNTTAETDSKELQYSLMRNPHESPSFASRPMENIGSDKDFVGSESSLARKKLMDSRTTTTESEGKEIGTKSILSAEPDVLNTKEQTKSALVMMSPSTSVTTTFSKKMPAKHSETNIEVTFNERSNSVVCSEEEHNPFGNLDMWIFPNNTRHLCITTAGNEVINLLGQTEAKTRPESQKKGNLPYGSHKKKKDKRIFPNLRKSRPESAANDAAGGVVGQVIKVAIIVGFGVLVFLTRQREPRKRKTEAEDRSFSIQDYMDQEI